MGLEVCLSRDWLYKWSGDESHSHIKMEFAGLSVQPHVCRDLDNEFTDNEDPELNLVSLSKTKHLGFQQLRPTAPNKSTIGVSEVRRNKRPLLRFLNCCQCTS